MRVNQKWSATVGLMMIIACFMISTIGADKTAEPVITIDPIGPTNIGDLLVVSGTTTLPVDSDIFVMIYALKNCTIPYSGAGGNIKIRSGTGGVNTWSNAVDTSCFGLGEYNVNVSAILGSTEKEGYIMGEPYAETKFMTTGRTLLDKDASQGTKNPTGNISLEKIGTKHVGDQFLVRGHTSLPVGVGVSWVVDPDQSRPSHPHVGEYPYVEASNQVYSGDSSSNRISLAVDTSDYDPGVYNVSCSVIKEIIPEKGPIKGDVLALEQFILEK